MATYIKQDHKIELSSIKTTNTKEVIVNLQKYFND